MESIDLIILGLATFRATRLLTRDYFFYPLREAIWSKYSPEYSRIGYLFTCEWCMSIWVGSLFSTWSIISIGTFRVFGLVLAVSAISGLLAAYEDR